jgi:hypothetical protein
LISAKSVLIVHHKDSSALGGPECQVSPHILLIGYARHLYGRLALIDEGKGPIPIGDQDQVVGFCLLVKEMGYTPDIVLGNRWVEKVAS